MAFKPYSNNFTCNISISATAVKLLRTCFIVKTGVFISFNKLLAALLIVG